jgi:lipopolysaccharide export system permease protein
VGSIIDRYLVREVAQTWLAVSLVLWLILVSARLSRFLAQAAAGELPGGAVFSLLGLKSVEFLVFMMPLALFLAVMLGLGRLYKDSEMAALAACGVGTAQLYRPLLALALVAALVLGWAALYLVPHTAALGYEVRVQAQRTADISGVGAGRFKEIRGGALVFYAESISRDRSAMRKVFVQVRGEDVDRVIVADSAYQTWDEETGDRFLVLVDGKRYEGLPGQADYRVLAFRQHGVLLEPGPASGFRKGDATPTARLWGSSDRREQAELQWRLSVPVAALALVFMAVPLCRTTPRQGRYGRLAVGVLAFIVYYNLMGTARVWLEQGVLPPALGIWWVHALPVLLGILLLQWSRLRQLWVRT